MFRKPGGGQPDSPISSGSTVLLSWDGRRGPKTRHSRNRVIHDLKTLILSFHPVIVIDTVEEDRVERLLDQVAEEMGIAVFEWSITHGLTRRGMDRMIHGTDQPLGVVRHLEGLTITAIYHLKDFAPHLTNSAVARKFREVAQMFSNNHSAIVLSGSPIELPNELAQEAVWFDLRLPAKDELRATIQPVMRSLALRKSVALHLSDGDLDRLLEAMSGMTLNQARQAIAYAGLIDGQLGPEDIAQIVERKAQVVRDGGLLEFFPVEDNLHELGGFATLKEWLARARVGFSEEARTLNLEPPRGILIVGVQGCGKSLAAKAIAREWQLPLLKLDAGRLYDKYIGESEKNFRRAVALAESMAPTVLWIDEIEKAMPTTGSSDQDGGLSRRLFAGFLTWLQEKQEAVFVVATANDLTHTPPELLRKGRFDEIFFVDLPDPGERRTIFEIHLRLRKQNLAAFDADALVDATQGFSGAEIEQVVIGALYRALYRKRALDTDLLLEEIGSTVPLSVSRREDIEALRHLAKGRFVSVR